jgi:hypothetical protein
MKWVKCSDRLPKESCSVLLIVQSKPFRPFMCLGIYHDTSCFPTAGFSFSVQSKDVDVIAWCKIKEPKWMDPGDTK